MFVFYHRRTAKAARAILAGGFKDGSGWFMTDRLWTWRLGLQRPARCERRSPWRFPVESRAGHD
jgi:hypothetical protein